MMSIGFDNTNKQVYFFTVSRSDPRFCGKDGFKRECSAECIRLIDVLKEQQIKHTRRGTGLVVQLNSLSSVNQLDDVIAKGTEKMSGGSPVKYELTYGVDVKERIEMAIGARRPAMSGCNFVTLCSL